MFSFIMIAVIGAGCWGKNIIREIHTLNKLAVVCDTDADILNEISALYNVRTTTDFQSVLTNPDISAVMLAIPSVLHFCYAKRVLLSGKDCFVEKPMCMSVKEGIELTALAKIHNRILMVGHILQYHPAITVMYQLIKEDYIGDVKCVISNRMNNGKIRKEENVLWSFAPHDISIILTLMNNGRSSHEGSHQPIKVIATGQDFITSGVHDITSTSLYFSNNRFAQITVSWLSPIKEQKMTIIGSKGMFVFNDCIEDKLQFFSSSICNPTVIPILDTRSPLTIECQQFIESIEWGSWGKSVPPSIECQEFVDSYLTRQSPPTDGDEGVSVLKVLENAAMQLNSTRPGGKENKIAYYKHESAIIDDNVIIGDNTKIWHFTHIMSGARIGRNCVIGQNVFIGEDVIIGDGCKIQNNVSLYTGLIAGNNVFFGPSSVFTNDLTPRAASPKGRAGYLPTIIEDGVTIGANATILCGLTIGHDAFIGAGAVVCDNVNSSTTMIGIKAHEIYSSRTSVNSN